MAFLGFGKKKNTRIDLGKEESLDVPPMLPPTFTQGPMPTMQQDNIPMPPDFEKADLEMPPPPSFEPENINIEEPVAQTIEEKAQVETPAREVSRGLIYLRINSYVGLMDEMLKVKKDLASSDESMARLLDLEIAKEKEYQKWHDKLADMNRKFNYIDNTLFKGE